MSADRTQVLMILEKEFGIDLTQGEYYLCMYPDALNQADALMACEYISLMDGLKRKHDPGKSDSTGSVIRFLLLLLLAVIFVVGAWYFVRLR